MQQTIHETTLSLIPFEKKGLLAETKFSHLNRPTFNSVTLVVSSQATATQPLPSSRQPGINRFLAQALLDHLFRRPRPR